MLESEVTKAPSDHETLNISEMRHEELETLVEFMYNDYGSVSSAKLKKHVRSLYLAAQRYEIPHLRDLCRNELLSSLSSSNALYVLELSHVTLDKPLNDAALSFIARNINTFLDSIEFKMFVARNPNLAVEITKAFLNPVMNPFEYESDDDDEDYEDDEDDDDQDDEDEDDEDENENEDEDKNDDDE